MLELVGSVLFATVMGWNWGTIIHARFQGADKAARKVRERLHSTGGSTEDSRVSALDVLPLSLPMIKKIACEEGFTYSGEGPGTGNVYMFAARRGARRNGNHRV